MSTNSWPCATVIEVWPGPAKGALVFSTNQFYMSPSNSSQLFDVSFFRRIQSALTDGNGHFAKAMVLAACNGSGGGDTNDVSTNDPPTYCLKNADLAADQQTLADSGPDLGLVIPTNGPPITNLLFLTCCSAGSNTNSATDFSTNVPPILGPSGTPPDGEGGGGIGAGPVDINNPGPIDTAAGYLPPLGPQKWEKPPNDTASDCFSPFGYQPTDPYHNPPSFPSVNNDATPQMAYPTP